MILKLGMQHRGLKVYKVCINVDPGLTLTYFTTRSNLVTLAFLYEKVIDAGHMTKMAAMPIYVKNPSKIFYSRTIGPISMKLGRQHPGLQPIIVCSNDDPWLVLTYFMARSNFGT